MFGKFIFPSEIRTWVKVSSDPGAEFSDYFGPDKKYFCRVRSL